MEQVVNILFGMVIMDIVRKCRNCMQRDFISYVGVGNKFTDWFKDYLMTYISCWGQAAVNEICMANRQMQMKNTDAPFACSVRTYHP
jgi:hypothetical protein